LTKRGGAIYSISMIITYHRDKLINAIVYLLKHTKFCDQAKLYKLLYFIDFKHFQQTGKSVTGQDYIACKEGPEPMELREEIRSWAAESNIINTNEPINNKKNKSICSEIPSLAPGPCFACRPLSGGWATTTSGLAGIAGALPLGGGVLQTIRSLIQRIRPSKSPDFQYFTKKEIRLLKEIASKFKHTKADDMDESTYLRNKPWKYTLREKGELQKIDYMLAIGGEEGSLSTDDAMDRMQERLEMYEIFGAG